MKKILLSLAVLASSFLNEVAAESISSQIEESMQEKIQMLGEGQSFAYVDLELTDADFFLLDKLKINFNAQCDRFGNLHLLKDELPAFLRKIGNDEEEVIQAAAEIITKTVYNLTNASNKNSAWVSVRASTPNHSYDMPRWHIDGSYYGPSPYPGIVFKFAAVLKGPSTLLYNLPDEMREIFNSNRNHREHLSQLLDLNNAESPKKGEGVFFIVADAQIGAVHSEPKENENRLFFSILVGDESEINELYLNWHPEQRTM